MTAIASLWLPILVSAVLVFLASSIIHMAPLWHRNELPAPPDGDRLQDAMRPFGLAPGQYMLPRCQSQPATASRTSSGNSAAVTAGSLAMDAQAALPAE